MNNDGNYGYNGGLRYSRATKCKTFSIVLHTNFRIFTTVFVLKRNNMFGLVACSVRWLVLFAPLLEKCEVMYQSYSLNDCNIWQ